jgi:ribosomal protein S18 acetylase RimI-like enzyme
MIDSYLQFIQEATKSSFEIKLLDVEEIKKFIKIFNDASPKFRESNYDVYAVIDENNYNVFVGGIVINKKPGLKVYTKYNLKCIVAVSFIYLKKKYRSLGIGQKLLDIPLKKYKSICLTTNKGFTTKEAYKLYKKNGFRIIEQRGKTTSWYWSKEENK